MTLTMRTIAGVVGALLILHWANEGLAAEGLLGHWAFDETSGTVAKDSSGNGHDGKVHAAAGAQGVASGALEFDGKSAFVELGDLGEYDAVTVAFWMKAVNVAKGDWQGLVTSDAWEEGVLHLAVRSGNIEVYLHKGGKERARLTGTKILNGVWYHVAVTADKKTRRMAVFLNGTEMEACDISGLATRLKLLKQVVGREAGARHFLGVIDDVRIYSRALAGADIQELCPEAPSPGNGDPRSVRLGSTIPDEGYCDQPYVVITKEGYWLCTMTTGPGREGAVGEHMVATLSKDRGRTWSKPVAVEPGDGPESSYGVPVIAPSGRIYVIYDYNGDKIETLNGKKIRADMLGWYVFKYSDDNGQTWSAQRHRIPIRLTSCDLANNWQGKVQIFWGIDKPIVVGRDVYFAFSKLGKYILDNGEGWFFHSDNLLTERDPARIRWELLPDGDHGLRAPEFGSVQEEHNIVPLADGKAFYCVYRTTTGYPCHAYSPDGCHTWTKPEPMTYTPGGRKMKSNRACPMLWRTAGGKYLFWFNNHSGKSYDGRNPIWLSGGVEKNGRIHWSQPEILLYDPDVNTRMSYPDLIEQDGRYWVTETNKTLARAHEVDKTLLEGLWNQGTANTVTREGLVLEPGPEQLKAREAALPKPLDLRQTGGLAMDLWLRLSDLAPGQVLVDGRDDKGRGLALTTAADGAVRLDLNDGTTRASWDSDAGLLKTGTWHHVAVIVDDHPKIITFVIDGFLCNGGEQRQYGWGRYAGDLGNVSGTGRLRLAPSLKGELKGLRLYGRYLRTSEAVAHFHAGPPSP